MARLRFCATTKREPKRSAITYTNPRDECSRSSAASVWVGSITTASDICPPTPGPHIFAPGLVDEHP
eukprot:223066-Prymnesium_polylepis.1